MRSLGLLLTVVADNRLLADQVQVYLLIQL